MDKRKIIVISLGGSLIIPKELSLIFLQDFKKFILANINTHKFIIVTGGGQICRDYINASMVLGTRSKYDLDSLGIISTMLNGFLIKNLLNELKPDILDHPNRKKNFKNVLIGFGYKPGWSTDYDASIIAKKYNCRTIYNLTNVDYVYNKDPKIKGAKALKKITYSELEKIQGSSFHPGMNTPFDPKALSYAKKYKIKIFILNGNNLQNFENILRNKNKKFIGTIIS